MRADGIEPTRPAWKAGVLPLNYAREAEKNSFARINDASSAQRKSLCTLPQTNAGSRRTSRPNLQRSRLSALASWAGRGTGTSRPRIGSTSQAGATPARKPNVLLESRGRADLPDDAARLRDSWHSTLKWWRGGWRLGSFSSPAASHKPMVPRTDSPGGGTGGVRPCPGREILRGTASAAVSEGLAGDCDEAGRASISAASRDNLGRCDWRFSETARPNLCPLARERR